jgi:hypothetical protein
LATSNLDNEGKLKAGAPEFFMVATKYFPAGSILVFGS